MFLCSYLFHFCTQGLAVWNQSRKSRLANFGGAEGQGKEMLLNLPKHTELVFLYSFLNGQPCVLNCFLSIFIYLFIFFPQKALVDLKIFGQQENELEVNTWTFGNALEWYLCRTSEQKYLSMKEKAYCFAGDLEGVWDQIQ